MFFSATKLFQNKDANLRRMVYLIIKELSPSSDEVIIITSTLMKDMSSKIDLYRANAIRVLCKIIDSQLLQQIERYLKQAIVDKSAVVASSVLCATMHLLSQNGEIARRWVNEIQEAVDSRHAMVQFHGVALMHAIRANDRLAVSKLVKTLTRTNLKSPLAQCLLVRYIAQVCGGVVFDVLDRGTVTMMVMMVMCPMQTRVYICHQIHAIARLTPGYCRDDWWQRASAVLRLFGRVPAPQERDGHL